MGLVKNQLLARKPSAQQAQANEAYQKAIAQIPKPKLRSPLRARFTEYFNHPFDAILDQSGQGWKTIKHLLDDGQIWKAWQDGDRLIGLGFGKTTRYALIDIDCGSPYHNEEGLRDIRWALEDIGINSTTLLRSSFSQGWHLYFAFSRPVPTFALSCLLHQTMEAAGLSVVKGILEIFPNRKGWQKDAVTQYNRHRLPLQPAAGSALLNADLCPYSQDLGTFLDRLDETAIANDIDLIEELATEAKRNYNPSKRKGFLPGSQSSGNPNARKWKKTLEEDIATGWTGRGQSNQFLRKVAEYGRIFLGYNDEYQLGGYIAKTAIAAPGFIPYCGHTREISAWSLRWARWAMKKRWPYGTRKGGQFKQLGKGGPTNEEKRAECLSRVADTVNDYQASGREWPKTIRARRKLIAGMANCSESTLNKPVYLPLWHPNHLEIAIHDDVQDIEAVQSSNLEGPGDTAMPENAVSHPDKYCVLFLKGRENVFDSRAHRKYGGEPATLLTFGLCTSSGRSLTIQTPQTEIEQGIEAFSVNQSLLNNSEPSTQLFVPRLLQPGDWVVEVASPHRLLRLASIDDEEGWCRCQDAESRRRGTRGELSHLSELLPAPPALIQEAIAVELKSLQPKEEALYVQP